MFTTEMFVMPPPDRYRASSEIWSIQFAVPLTPPIADLYANADNDWCWVSSSYNMYILSYCEITAIGILVTYASCVHLVLMDFLKLSKLAHKIIFQYQSHLSIVHWNFGALIFLSFLLGLICWSVKSAVFVGEIRWTGNMIFFFQKLR